MSGANEWDDLMPHNIRVRRTYTMDNFAKRTFTGAYTTYKCLFDDNVRILRTSEGEMVTISRTAYVNTRGEEISDDDEITFPDGSVRPIVGIATHYDTDGSIHNVEVVFS